MSPRALRNTVRFSLPIWALIVLIGWAIHALALTPNQRAAILSGGCFAGATIDENFAAGQYCGPGGLYGNLSISRASSGYAQTAEGVLVNFPSNTFRITDQGLLIEESRTNIALQSQALATTPWTVSQATGANNVVASPDGTTTASSLIENTSNAQHTFSQSITKSATSLVYTTSVYVSNSLSNNRRLAISLGNAGGTSGAYAVFNLAGAAVAINPTNFGSGWTGGAATITALANGWYRCSLSVTTDATTDITISYDLDNGVGSGAVSTTYLGNGLSGLYFWGAQLEQATFSTSYIPTTSGSAVRAADSVTARGNLLVSLKATAGTIVGAATNTQPLQLSATIVGNNGLETLGRYVSNSAEVVTYNGSQTLFASPGATYLNASPKFGLGWAPGARNIVSNGVSSTDNNSINNGAPIYIGGYDGSTQFLDAYLTRLTLWNSKLPTGVLQVLAK